ncbi:heavy-metal-associated domain-containing protein [Lysobacter soli]|uniref:heavy-metal-associated domain-containing protein n=1 Tax=Lysobacter soli TaxID=453783 RepID=UPI00209E29C3|nr:heavy-metal-associated domain-containing protein [Lysobacter soli]UTA55627.1 heavy-metal-associated domain-containing protein [Lysobacter soli]
MKLLVEGMTCEHCVRTITSAIHQLDPTAQVHVDLAEAAVLIPISRLAPPAAVKAVQEAGYTARLAEDIGPQAVVPTAKRCCGTCHA